MSGQININERIISISAEETPSVPMFCLGMVVLVMVTLEKTSGIELTAWSKAQAQREWPGE